MLVFIHGGAFSIGTGSYGFYGPERLIDYGIVLVTFNYRLGILGMFADFKIVSIVYIVLPLCRKMINCFIALFKVF